jgi:DNA-directed RNA polymerase specialized sigma24 family protein
MTNLPKEWRFLRSGWMYAFVLTGREAAATEMVSKALQGVAARNDLVSSRRRRRLFFAILFREGQKIPRQSEPAEEKYSTLATLHKIQEPGRSALALLHLRLFDPDQIAVIIGKTEKELPSILTAAREDFSKQEASRS